MPDPSTSLEEADSGIHRAVARPIGHPAVVRHLCLFETPLRTGADRDGRALRYFVALRETINASQSVTVKPTGSAIETLSRGQEETLSFFWHHISASIRLELHTEYVTITSVLDFSFYPDETRDWTHDTENKLAELEANDSFFRTMHRSLLVLLASRGKIKAKHLSVFFHEVIWRAFADEIMDKNEILTSAALGHVRGDFRGIVTGQPAPGIAANAAAANDGVDFNPPFTKLGLARGGPHNYDEPSEEWKSNTIQALLPFVLIHEILVGYEFTASTLLCGRMIYFSALGLRPPKRDEHLPAASPGRLRVGARDPVWFYLHSSTDDPWDIGRAIADMTRLGTLRFAAVYQLNELHDANRDLTSIHIRIQELLSEIAQLETSLPTAPAGFTTQGFDLSFQSIANSIVELRNRRQRINDPFALGLEYRVRRSRFYVDSFQTTLPLIEEGSIPRYQPYSKFILRRLGESFTYIRNLDKKLSELNKIDVELREAYTSLRMVRLTLEIKDSSRETAALTTKLTELSVATSANTKAIDNEDKEIKSIQDFGEAVLLLALLPYYFAHSFEGLLTKFWSPPVGEVLTEIGWILGGVIGFGLYRGRLRKGIADRKRAIEESAASNNAEEIASPWQHAEQNLGLRRQEIERGQYWLKGVWVGIWVIVVMGGYQVWQAANHSEGSRNRNLNLTISVAQESKPAPAHQQEATLPSTRSQSANNPLLPRKSSDSGSSVAPWGLRRFDVWPDPDEGRPKP
jgi:hypothetical protein